MRADDGSAASMNPDDHYVVVSSDSHCGADLYDYKPYLEKKWHAEFDEWARTYSNPWEFMDPRLSGLAADLTVGEDTPMVAGASWRSSMSWDPRRVAHMEADGVAAEVLFPNTAPPFLPTSVLSGAPPATRAEYERRWAGLRAHNRWLADFCAELPGRRAGVAQVMLYDVEDAVREVRWVADAGLTGGIILPMDGSEGGELPLHSLDYEPLWSVCEELQVPVHRHGSTPGGPKGDNSPAGIVVIGMVEHSFYLQRGLGHLILAGVFERHPGLKFVITESGSGWVPGYLQGLDGMVAAIRHAKGPMSYAQPYLAELSLLPSEYFRRNCYLGASLMIRAEVDARHAIGVDKMMWGADYPHAEGTYPFSRESMRLLFHDVPPHECRQMLGANAVHLYGFDQAYLQQVADRVCPTVAEVATPLANPPRVPEDTYAICFHDFSDVPAMLVAGGADQ
jgi:predicted TIM-barrel fold metal-dependent hydrolase